MTVKLIWGIAGTAALGLGVIGIALPLLPTVPFLLLAAFCYARSSNRLHTWLVEHRHFGPPITDWQQHGAISRRAKILATISIGAVLMLSIALGLGRVLLAIQAGILGTVLTFIWTRPTGQRREPDTTRQVDRDSDSGS